MEKLFYATHNQYKVQTMKNRLANLNIQVITPYDLDLHIEVEENENTVVENAILKAKSYYDITKIPTLGANSSLFVEKFTHQPGLFVRRINGKYLTDDELENYYIQELNTVGGTSKAYYITSLALFIEDHIYTTKIQEDAFILTSQKYEGNKNNDALG